MSVEVWKKVGQYPMYDVSTHGQVRSWHPKNGRGDRADSPRIVRTFVSNTGYLQLKVYHRRGSRPKSVNVHRLVANAFLGSMGDGYEVNHIDGNKTNCRLDNLEWCTRPENMLHASRVMGVGCGERNGAAKLTPRRLFGVLSDRATGMTQQMVASKHGISTATVSRIERNLTWRHLDRAGATA